MKQYINVILTSVSQEETSIALIELTRELLRTQNTHISKEGIVQIHKDALVDVIALVVTASFGATREYLQNTIDGLKLAQARSAHDASQLELINESNVKTIIKLQQSIAELTNNARPVIH